MLKVTIDRTHWLRGEGPIRSRLWRKGDNKMCCIGFLACALGATKEQLFKKKALRQLATEYKMRFLEFQQHDSSEYVMDAYSVNDNKLIDESTRERRIVEIGQKMNVEFSFVN